ncbi:MAG: hypothetical protein DHS20C14_03090 [Phycisphaeraceae bacterium]|nr:MAG: hypothetical protein DHS20C14_03090 [Phycisphaeraceae bacterium]
MLMRFVLPLGAALCLAPVAQAQPYVLVADAVGDKIVRYNANTSLPFDHFVGKGLSPLAAPMYMREMPDGRIAVASRDSNSIEVYDEATGEWDETLVQAGSSSLSGPKAFCFDDEGNIYVSSSINNRVLKYNSSGAFVRILIEVGLDDPSGLTVGPDGNLYVCSRGNNKVRFYDTETGERIDIVNTTAVPLLAPNDINFDDGGNMYISGRDSNNIIRVTAFGGASVFVPTGPGLLQSPGQIIFNDMGNLIVACPGSNSVLEYAVPSALFIESLVSSANLGGLNTVGGVAFGPLATTRDACEVADLDFNGFLNVDDIELFVDSFLGDGCDEPTP